MNKKISEKILFVDDDVNLLEGIKRQYRKQFNLAIASSGAEGLELLKREHFAVVVSDLQMPEMNGIEFLRKVREKYPDTTRIMLTGNADLSVAMDAVNEGSVFRFCTKPCPRDVMVNALSTGIEQYRLVMAERELLEKTLLGSVKVLTDILSIVNPVAFGRASRISNHVSKIAKKLGCRDLWKLQVAAMLSQIGCVTIPAESLEKVYQHEQLSPEEKKMFAAHPLVGKDLISKIPRLEEIGEIIAYQEKHFDGSGIPADSVKEKDIPLGSRILKVALDFDALMHAKKTPPLVIEELESRNGWYDPAILEILPAAIAGDKAAVIRKLTINELKTNMVLAQDVKTTKGLLLVSQGQEVDMSLIRRLKNFAQTVGVQQPIKVIVFDNKAAGQSG